MTLLEIGVATAVGGLCLAMAAPAAAIDYPTLTEGDGFYTVTNPSPFYVSLFFVTNPGATVPGRDSTTQPQWQAGYCVGGCLGGPGFFYDAMSFADEIGPGQTSSKFFFTPPPASGSYKLLLSNADDSDAGYVTGSVSAPEPASWALMLIGFGGLGAVLRLRGARPAGALS